LLPSQSEVSAPAPAILSLAQSLVISAGMPKSRPRTVTSERIKAHHNQQACHPWSLDFGIPAEMTRLYLSFLAQTENCRTCPAILLPVTHVNRLIPAYGAENGENIKSLFTFR